MAKHHEAQDVIVGIDLLLDVLVGGHGRVEVKLDKPGLLVPVLVLLIAGHLTVLLHRVLQRHGRRPGRRPVDGALHGLRLDVPARHLVLQEPDVAHDLLAKRAAGQLRGHLEHDVVGVALASTDGIGRGVARILPVVDVLNGRQFVPVKRRGCGPGTLAQLDAHLLPHLLQALTVLVAVILRHTPDDGISSNALRRLPNAASHRHECHRRECCGRSGSEREEPEEGGSGCPAVDGRSARLQRPPCAVHEAEPL
mmetsp:Transcript_41946/g.125467  ORF Transcript_41946/g.125467 Transcript_41946/m.125467 type:complete len:253 (-) Transcript_41946:69-827(-)